MHVFFKFVVVLAFVQLGYCQDLPVDKCHLEDSVCMTAAFQKAIPIFAGGLPDQGIEVLDVLDLDDVNFDLLGLKGSFTNGKLKGLKTATIDNVTWNTKKKTISVTFHLECGVEGHYKAGGRLLILPVSGEGEAKLKIGRLENNLVMSYTIEKDAEGKDHVILKKLTFDYDVKDNAHVNLTNLFNGKKELSDAMLQFLNENLREIIVEYGRPLMEVTNKKIFKNVKTFLSKNVISDIAYV